MRGQPLTQCKPKVIFVPGLSRSVRRTRIDRKVHHLGSGKHSGCSVVLPPTMFSVSAETVYVQRSMRFGASPPSCEYRCQIVHNLTGHESPAQLNYWIWRNWDQRSAKTAMG